MDKNDKPFTKYPAYLTNPMKSNYDSQAKTMRDKVLSYKDKLPKTVTGKIWYVSNKGKDTNDGSSPETAWGSIFAMNFNKDKIQAGDAVLFERGGVYRGVFTAKSGVYYGAYGKGDKPCIYASDQNYAKVSWTYKNANIWVCDAPFSKDVGTLIFNHGESVGFKKDKRYYLENNGDFWCDCQNGHKLYVYMDKNPAKLYKSIEIGINKNIISIEDGTKKVTIENLCLKYTGGHAISATGDVRNIIIRGCEIGFIGGSYLDGSLRFGNAIEFFVGGNDILVENNWIYQIYDSGITHQGGGEYIAKNLNFTDNLIEYCGMGSYEYWLAGHWDVSWAENVTFADNICRFAGYCWGGEQRADKCSTHIRTDVSCRNTMKNFKVTGNIFDQSSENLLEIGSTSETYPEMKGNIYAQNSKGLFGTYKTKAGVDFDEEIKTFINDYVGDKKATIVFY